MLISKKTKWIVLPFLGITLGLGLIEILARIILPYPQPYISLLRTRAPDLQMDSDTDLKNLNYNPFIQRRPNSDWICNGKTPERMNNEGFRDRTFVISKTDHKKRIACIGDSFTEGWMGSREFAFPRILEETLGEDYEVYNFGLANRSPLRYVPLYQKVVSKYKPDIVLVCLYRNDLIEDESLRPYVQFDSEGVPVHFDFKRYFRHTPRMPQTKWEKRIDKWQWYLCQYSRLFPYLAVYLTVDIELRQRAMNSSKIHHLQDKWKQTEKYLLWLKNETKKNNEKILISYAPDQEEFKTLSPFFFEIQSFSKKNQIPFFTASNFLQTAAYESYYIPHDGHFSNEGNKMYAKELAAWLIQAISPPAH